MENLSEDDSSIESTRDRRVAIWLTVGLISLLAATYAIALALVGERLPRGTTIGGVDVGGMTPIAAKAKLQHSFGADAARTITVAAQGRREDIAPSQVGLFVDYTSSVNQVAHGGWSPADLLSYVVGGADHDLVVLSDPDKLTAAIRKFATRVDTPAVDGTVTFRGTRVRSTRASPGSGIDVAAAVELVKSSFPRHGDVVPLPTQIIEPDIGNDEVTRAVKSLANVAVSAPVSIAVRGHEVELRPKVFARTLSFENRGGTLALAADPVALSRILAARLTNLSLAPVDATVRIVDGEPKVIPGTPGVTVDSQELAVAFAGAAVSEGRRVVASVTETAPSFTTADAQALRIRRLVSSFTTYYPHAEYRNVNIGRTAELISGTVLKPGDVFSFNDVVGERTPGNGFTVGPVIADGVYKDELGGGVGQAATTVFNAAFFAGLKDVEHKTHSLYISRYPVGREATVAWGSVDLRFENDTPYGILIEAWIVPSTSSHQGSFTVRMWSTKYWDITTSQSARYNYTDPGVRYIDSPDCAPFAGQQGFDIDVYRYFHEHGSDVVDHKEVLHTRYLAGDKVVCGKPPRKNG